MRVIQVVRDGITYPMQVDDSEVPEELSKASLEATKVLPKPANKQPRKAD